MPLRRGLPWSWITDGRGTYLLRHNLIDVGTISLIPGHVHREGYLLDVIVEHLNNDLNET